MNLFTETLKTYLIEEWERAMSSPDSDKKVIFIVESLDPDNTIELFSALEEHRLKGLQQKKLQCHFKVAKNLWLEWCKHQDTQHLHQKMVAKGGSIDENGDLKWVDQDDRLTKWRNEPKPEDIDGLVIVLLGFNHASDQGGLADFHRVDETRVWKAMGQNFIHWIRRINDDLNLDSPEHDIENFDNLLHQLFKVRPRLLIKLADFFEQKVYSQKEGFDSIKGVIEQFYKSLPFWDIPPLFNVSNTKKSANLIKEADAFISHQKFKSSSDQKKAWSKLDKAFTEGNLEIPEVLSSQPLYQDLAEFSETLRDFIYKANAEAKTKLMQTDLLPVLEVLKLRTGSSPKKDKIYRLSGSSVEVFLQAVWQTLLEFETQAEGRPLADVVQEIQVSLTRFNHDLDAESLAKELLFGCLGGLPEWFEGIDLRFPIDEDQALELRNQWKCFVPLMVNTDEVTYGTSRARPHLVFKINLKTCEEFEKFKPRVFQWSFGPTHPERVQFDCAKWVLEKWEDVLASTDVILSAFSMSDVIMTALYFAADEDEANRLVSQALCEMQMINLAEKIDASTIDRDLWNDLKTLSSAYLNWLRYYVQYGYFSAMQEHFIAMQRAYEEFAKRVLDKKKAGSEELLRCFYKAFLIIDKNVNSNDAFLRSAIVWGISPPVLELIQARSRFLCDSFPEVVGEHLISRNGKNAFDRLLNLVEIHRPLAGLVIDDQKTLSAEIKSFGILHHLGTPPSTEKSLAVQTLLRDEENDDDDNISDLVRPMEESSVVVRVLSDYQSLYPFAQDGLRILAVHVEELATILSGVDRFLRNYLKHSSEEWPAFHCEVMVYSTSSSPLSVESRLASWRHQLMEDYREKGRSVIISVAHHFAPTPEKMVKLLKDEIRKYDIAFLFRFLSSKLTGDAETALPFEFDFNENNFSQFPICEYPRPIQQDEQFKRKSLLSNRRLRIQTHHADLSARLRHPQNPEREHLIFGQIDYHQLWQEVVEAMHQTAQWVACIDPFVDKHLLSNSDKNGGRKIVGFTSGLGAYGELNLSISTEQDTLSQLTSMVTDHLIGLLPFQSGENFDAMAVNIVEKAEEVIGLSSLRAVVGQGEKIREVIGFAAIRNALSEPEDAVMTQLLPVDSLQHWFAGSDVTHRPDLLQLSLIMREDDVPLVQAVLIECKFAQQNESHLMKAFDQVQDGLSHLTQLLTPNRCDIRRVTFDRRYWWAQLQRSITSRHIISMPEQQREKLDMVLEQLTEGYYEIHWQGAIFTFWTDDPSHDVKIENIALPAGVISSPYQIPDNASIRHVSIGYQGLMEIFEGGKEGNDNIDLVASPITVRPALTQSGEADGVDKKLLVPEKENSETNQTPSDEVAVPAEVEKTVVQVNVAKEASTALEEQQAQATESEEVVKNNAETSPTIELPFSLPPEKLLIGSKSNGDPVYWHYGHPQLANRHMLLFGTSGSGKTYGIQCLLAEMAKERMRSLIIDYTDGFLPNQVESRFSDVTNPQNHFVITNKLPLNPFRRQQQIIDPSIPPIEENSYQVAARVTSIFTSVYNTMGDQQISSLVRVLEEGIEENPNFELNEVIARLREDSQNGETLANKLEPFIKSDPFRVQSDSAWDGMLTSKENWVHVLQLKGLSREIQKLVTEFALWDLWDYVCNTGNKNRPIPVVLDEIQNLDHRSDSPIDKMLREGRKFGLSLILATQTTSQFDQEQRDRLFQAGHKLFFKPASTEINRFADLLSVATGISKSDWGERLAKLQKGQCWSLGPVMSSSGVLREKPELVSVTSLENRDFGV